MSCIREPNAEPIPGYRLIEPLGSGGFGEVWKCEVPGGLFKAIKFVYGNLNSLDVEGVRAEQELQALQRVKEVRHPFVLSLDRIEVVDGELVIVMELADKSLHDALIESQSAGLIGIPRDGLLRYIRDAAEALDHMNEKHNLQHLDIKPRNLFLVSDRVKVADFGLVKQLERQTGSAQLSGVTPLYAPPETFGGKISERSDQYSLAIVYQELLTGQRPFAGKNPRQLAQQHLQGEPELRPLPEGERTVVARALSKDPLKRFPNCLAFVRALYTSAGKARPEPLVAPEDRVKGLAETMEHIQLEQGNGLSEIDASPYTPVRADEASLVGMTVAQPESGALRPTVLIGVGSFGRRALRELRCRFFDRLGDVRKIPLIRFLYVDSDSQAVQEATRGTPEIALGRTETYHLPLQGVTYYRRRQLDHLCEWLPREKLYAIPRSGQTQGCRALGRLAFVDNHLRFLARVRREVQHACHPDGLYQSVTQTGLALRDNVPQIYVVAAAGGGSSGYLADLGYGLRRQLHQLHLDEAEVILFLFCGAPSDPATPRSEQANLYAALTELNHFTDPSVPFAAQYGVDGQRIVDQGPPFTCTYLLQLANRNPEALRDTLAHLGSYLFHELTTPLGLRLSRERLLAPDSGATPFRSFGTYSVWFPRGLLLRFAAREVCRRLIDEWQASGEPTAQAEVEAACAKTLAEPELRPEALMLRIEEAARTTLGASPAEALTALLASLEDQSQQSFALEDRSSWVQQALTRVLELVGTGVGAGLNGTRQGLSYGEYRKSHMSRTLTAAAERVAVEWDERLATTAYSLMEHPGKRVAAAEAGFTRFMDSCQDQSALHQARLNDQAGRTESAWRQLEAALQVCLLEGEGSSWGLSALLSFGNRSRRMLRVFMDHLSAFARQCLAEEMLAAGQRYFVCLRGRLAERVRELSFCRQRLCYLQDKLESSPDEAIDFTALPHGRNGSAEHSPAPSTESFWESIRQSATVNVVLPEGEQDLERAAQRFAGTVGPEVLNQLDLGLQDRVLEHLGGLHAACASSNDLLRSLGLPLVEQAAAFLGEHLPITDVAQVELTLAGADRHDLPGQIKECLLRAQPLVSSRLGRNQTPYLLLPASDSGKALGETALGADSQLQLVRVPGQAHLMFCREQGYLSTEDLQNLIGPCRAAYDEVASIPQASPHSRFDILDWMPLDP
jgi:serine/threonine protein kinase